MNELDDCDPTPSGDAALDKPDPRWHLRVRGLTKRFGPNLVLDHVDFDVERGKVNVIIGASGAGKSVLVKHFMCLLRPDKGSVWVDGTDVFALTSKPLATFRRKFGLVFQFAALFDSLSVEDNCAFPLREHTRKTKGEIREIVNDRLAALGLDGTQKKFPGELSGGQRKRVGLARALVLSPEILIFDEPTTGLDPLATRNVDEMILSAAERYNVTSVVISHDMASVFRIADRIAMLHDKKILAAGTPEQIRAHTNDYLRSFISASLVGRADMPEWGSADMRGVSAGVKVGILFIFALAGMYVVWKNLSSNPAGDSSYGLWAQFRDASGLPVGSKVVVAGLPVGEISGLAIDGRYARVTFRIRDDVKVWSSGVAYKKSTSLLGDYYIEIDPGSEADQAPDGSTQPHTLLANGDRVPTVVESTSVDQLLRRIDETIPDVDAVLASVKDLSEELRGIVDGPIRSIATNLDGLIQKNGDTVSEILAKADRSMERIDAITKDIRKITGGADARVDAILDNLDDVALQAKDLVATARAEVQATGEKVRDKLDLVDDVIANTESITHKIDTDQGTLGRLVNDSTIADNVEDLTEDAGGFLGTLFGLQTYVGLRSELNVRARSFRHYLTVELHTRPDKFYLIELERGPRGGYPDVSLTLDPTISDDTWIRRAVIEDRTRFTFQFAKQMYGWLTLRYGIKESTGGIGADADVKWLDRGLHLSLDAFDATFDRWPRLKLAAAVELFHHIYVLGGIDEALNAPDELQIMSGTGDVPVQFDTYKFGRDAFLGAMIRFNDHDLAALLAVGGSALGSIGK